MQRPDWGGGQGAGHITARLSFPPQDVEVERTNHFAMVNLRTAAPTVCVSRHPGPREVAWAFLPFRFVGESLTLASALSPGSHRRRPWLCFDAGSWVSESWQAFFHSCWF